MIALLKEPTFYIKFGESLRKICGISKQILRVFESKNFRIMKSVEQRAITEIIILKKFLKNLMKFY